jgi:hypothetical protein
MFKAKLILSAAIAIAPVISLLPLSGCEDERVGVYAQEGYAYEPGYYYDEGYWDTYHHWHPREYYYFDGHNWDHRDFVPHDFVARERHVADDRMTRSAPQEHSEAEHGPEDHLH